jgi:natural product biosynthesis luciferase-like monooxygenase protein
VQFGIMFFSSVRADAGPEPYELLLRAAHYADTHGFQSIWTPERHFHEFGGLFPNPAVTSAALATITQTLQLRAGSVIAPLHHAIRIAEEWAVVDQLSRGRVAISFGSGWNVDDFVFFPERYARRHAIMFEQIEVVRRLWRGEAIEETNSFGKPVQVTLSPRPVQPALPIWITSSGNEATFAAAGRLGANVLTHLLGQDLPRLAGKVAVYRQARADHGHDPAEGIVSLMLHTFVGPSLEAVRELTRGSMREYLRSALALERRAAAAGGVISGGHKTAAEDIGAADVEDLLDAAYERYLLSGSLLGTIGSCSRLLHAAGNAGVNDIACLIDFGLDTDTVMAGLERLNELRESFGSHSFGAMAAVGRFLEPLES